MLRFATFGYDSVFLMVSSGAKRPKMSTLFSSPDLEDQLKGSVSMDAMERLLKQEVETVRSEHTHLIHCLNISIHFYHYIELYYTMLYVVLLV